MKGFAALTLCLIAGAAVAQEQPLASKANLQATAADAARVTAIKNRCLEHIGIDVGYTADLQRALVADGVRQVGKDAFLPIVKAEQARIRAEIEASEVAVWCRRQKAVFEKPFPDVFRP